MAIGDDFTIDYTNKRITHTSGTTVYKVNDLYSWIQDVFDELTQMDNPVPMSAQTPTEYTMINGWFIDDESVKYLKEGAIKTSGYLNEIQILKLKSSGYTDAIAGDIGKQVLDDSTPIGPLLAYNNTTRKWWIRTGSGTAIAGDSVMSIADSGTGAGTADGDSVDGEDLFANVYTLGTIETTPGPQIYIFQAGEAINEWSNLTNWDRGQIDVLIKVKEAGVEIDNAVITVFARQQGDLFDHYEIDLSNGGRNAVPLATAADLDNTRPDYYIFFDNASGTLAAGDIIRHPTTGAVEWSAEVVEAPTQLGSTGIYVVGIRGYKDDGTNAITDNDAFEDTGESKTGTIFGSATGCLGTGYVKYKSQTGAWSTGDVMTGTTSAAKRRILADAEDGTAGMLLFDTNTGITGTARAAYYKDFTDGEEITDETTGDADVDGSTFNAISGFDDITVAFVNGTATHGGTTGTFIEGERVTWPTGESGILLRDTGSVITLGNCTTTSLNGKTVTGDSSGATCTCSQDLQSAHTMTKAFEQATAKNYDVIVECGKIYNAGRTLADVYEYFKFLCEEDSKFSMYTVKSGAITVLDGEEYIAAYDGYTPKKASPLGTFAGGVMFGAQGVWLEGMHDDDVQNYSLIDSDGTTQTPPNKQAIKVINIVSGDRVSVFRTSAGEIDKAMYTSHASSNSAGNSTFVVDGSPHIAVDTPAEGVIRIRDISEDTEHRIRYASWSGDTFTLITKITGSTTSDGGSNTINDSGASFLSEDIKPGDIVRNSTDLSWAHVVTVDSDTKITTTPLVEGTDQTWQSGDGYEFHTLPVTYGSSDKAYVPFIDAQATSTEISVTVIYTTDRDVLTRVRRKGILPFEVGGTFGSTGLTVAAIRTTDAIVT